MGIYFQAATVLSIATTYSVRAFLVSARNSLRHRRLPPLSGLVVQEGFGALDLPPTLDRRLQEIPGCLAFGQACLTRGAEFAMLVPPRRA
ncbi:MAG: hypothetical protein V3T66_01600 [Alphaproteobacteria bacterium]